MKVRLLAMAFGFFLVAGTAYAGPVPGGPDTDGDTVENAFDNCRDTPNAPQADTDHNGCGDSCTTNIQCDINGDTSVGTADFNILRMNFGNAVPPGTLGDCGDQNGVVATPDFNFLRMTFGNSTGPSGISTAQCEPTTCRCTPQ